jgi:outer membrane protein
MMESFTLSRLLMLATVCVLWSPGAVGADPPSAAAAVTLRAAIAEALEKSPHLLNAEESVAAAQIRHSAAASRFGPRISPSLNTGTSPAGSSPQSLGVNVSQLLPTGALVQASSNVLRYGSGPSELRDAGFSIGMSQPLLRGFGVVATAEREAAALATQTAERGAVDARRQLVVRIAQTYFSVVRQQRLDLETERAVARAEKLYEMSNARASVGLATQLDVFRAGLLRSQAKAALLRERDALYVAREELNLLLGRPVDSPIVADGNFKRDIEELELPEPAERTAGALKTMQVFEAHARLEDARRNASIAKWNQLPDINLDVSYTRRGVGAPASAAYLGLFNGWRVGLSTTYSFDAAGAASAAALAGIAVRAAERGVADAEQRALMDAQRASRGVARAIDTIAVQQDAVDLAKQQLDLATMRYEKGLADNLEIIDAENNVFQAQSALISAEIDHAIAILTLQRASGALDPERLR